MLVYVDPDTSAPLAPYHRYKRMSSMVRIIKGCRLPLLKAEVKLFNQDLEIYSRPTVYLPDCKHAAGGGGKPNTEHFWFHTEIPFNETINCPKRGALDGAVDKRLFDSM